MNVWCCAGGMGAAPARHQESPRDPTEPQPPTMADFMRERRRKGGGGGGALCSLTRKLANVTRRHHSKDPERFGRQLAEVTAGWRPAELGALLRLLRRERVILAAELAAERARPTPAISCREHRWWCDVVISCGGGSIPAHAFMLAARTHYWRPLASQPRTHRVVTLPASVSHATRRDVLALLRVIYPDYTKLSEKEDDIADDDPDLIHGDINDNDSESKCPLSRLVAAVGVSTESVQSDMLRLLHTGSLSDCALAVGSRRFPCHRAVLGAASRYCRAVLSRSAGGGGGGDTEASTNSLLTLDARVLPERFVLALLHAAYTQQVDVDLIEPATPPTGGAAPSTSGWSSSGRNKAPVDKLDDICQLYEIARFLEMEAACAGCETAAAESLTPRNVAALLAWSLQPHASRWLHRAGERYVRENFAAVCAVWRATLTGGGSTATAGSEHAGSARSVLQAALAAALTHRGLPTSDDSAGRALCVPPPTECPRGGAVSKEASVRQVLAPFLPHLRLEHLPHNHPIFVTCGLARPAARGADAWLARGTSRVPRPLPQYIQTLESMLETQQVSEEEIDEVLRANKMPDTLYMVCAESGASVCGGNSAGGNHSGGNAAPPPPPALTALAARLAAAGGVPAGDSLLLYQICVQATRRLGLPDSYARSALLTLNQTGSESREDSSPACDVTGDWDVNRCSSPAAESEECSVGSVTSLRGQHHIDSLRRRELPAVVAEGQVHRSVSCVPDVAVPNANTHLLYPRTGPVGRVLTLDLGDGAEHVAGARGPRTQIDERNRDPQCSRAVVTTQPNSDLQRASYSPFKLRNLSSSPTVVHHVIKAGTHRPARQADTLDLCHNTDACQTVDRCQNSDNFGKFNERVDVDDDDDVFFNSNLSRSRDVLICQPNDSYRDDSCQGVGSYRDLKGTCDLYPTSQTCHFDRRNVSCEIDNYMTDVSKGSIDRKNRHKSNTLELYTDRRQNDFYSQSTSKNSQNYVKKDYLDCTLPKNCSIASYTGKGVKKDSGRSVDYRGQTNRLLGDTYTQHRSYSHDEFMQEKKLALQKQRQHGDSPFDDRGYNKDVIGGYKDMGGGYKDMGGGYKDVGGGYKDVGGGYKDGRHFTKDKEIKYTEHYSVREETNNLDKIQLKSLKIHNDHADTSPREYSTGSLKLQRGKIQSYNTKSGPKEYNTLNTRIDSSGSISSHGTLLPRSNSSLSGRNSAQSALSGHNSAQSGQNSAQSGQNSAQSGQNSAQSGHYSALSRHNSSQSVQNSALSSQISAQSAHNSAQSVYNSALSSHNLASGQNQNSAQSSQYSAQSGQNSAQSSHNSAQSGQNSSQSNHNSPLSQLTSLPGRSSPHSGAFMNSPVSLSNPTHIGFSHSSQHVTQNIPLHTYAQHKALPQERQYRTHREQRNSDLPRYKDERGQNKDEKGFNKDERGVKAHSSPTASNLNQCNKISNVHIPIDVNKSAPFTEYGTRDRLSPRNIISPRDTLSPRDTMSPSRNMAPKDFMCSRDSSLKIDNLFRDKQSSHRSRSSSRDNISKRDLTTKGKQYTTNNIYTRDIQSDILDSQGFPENKIYPEGSGYSGMNQEYQAGSKGYPGELVRGRRSLPGHARPRSRERENVLTLHAGSPGPSETRHRTRTRSDQQYIDLDDTAQPPPPNYA